MKTEKRSTLAIFSTLVVLGSLILSACATPALAALTEAEKQTATQTAKLQLGEVKFNGEISEISTNSVTVEGVVFRTDAQTSLPQGLSAGKAVKVQALLLPDGSRYALSLSLDDSPSSANEFEFYGTVQAIDSASWMIADQLIKIDGVTQIDAGIVVGDTVKVEGTLQDGSLLANKIEKDSSQSPESTETPAPAGQEVEISGLLEAINGGIYMVGGVEYHTNSATEIKGILAVGDFVKVHAGLQADGTYLAREIEKSDDMSASETPEMSETPESDDDEFETETPEPGDDDSNDDSGDDSDDDSDDDSGDDDDDDDGDDSGDDSSDDTSFILWFNQL